VRACVGFKSIFLLLPFAESLRNRSVKRKTIILMFVQVFIVKSVLHVADPIWLYVRKLLSNIHAYWAVVSCTNGLHAFNEDGAHIFLSMKWQVIKWIIRKQGKFCCIRKSVHRAESVESQYRRQKKKELQFGVSFVLPKLINKNAAVYWFNHAICILFSIIFA